MVEADDVLLRRWHAGDEAAFETVFTRHYGAVFRVLVNVLGSREAAEDIAQETFLAFHNSPPPYVDTSLATWLCRVALNRGYNALRGERRAQERLEQLDPPLPQDPQVEVVRIDERKRVRAALARLPERQSKLLLLRHAGLSYAEVAAVLGVAPGSVGTLLARAEQAFVAVFDSGDAVEQLMKAKAP